MIGRINKGDGKRKGKDICRIWEKHRKTNGRANERDMGMGRINLEDVKMNDK